MKPTRNRPPRHRVRVTRQREALLKVLTEAQDHPTPPNSPPRADPRRQSLPRHRLPHPLGPGTGRRRPPPRPSKTAGARYEVADAPHPRPHRRPRHRHDHRIQSRRSRNSSARSPPNSATRSSTTGWNFYCGRTLDRPDQPQRIVDRCVGVPRLHGIPDPETAEPICLRLRPPIDQRVVVDRPLVPRVRFQIEVQVRKAAASPH